jgi:SAM-dependent methyltransferase
LKALVQRVISWLPSETSYAAYYWIQRTFGRMAEFNPGYGFFVGVEGWKRLSSLGLNPRGKVFFEIGTGRAPIVPIAYYLMGALQTITVDLNPYLEKRSVRSALSYVAANTSSVEAQFGTLLDHERWSRFVDFARKTPDDVEGLLQMCGIEYLAPADAAKTELPARSVDFHTSNTALEHIPRGILLDILREGARILREDGVSLHRIDYSDHFAHSDKRISLINFLQYSNAAWSKYADNRYMYMNRLRHDDFLEIFDTSGQGLVAVEPDLNGALLEDLRRGRLRVSNEFSAKTPEVLATTGAWIIARPRPTRAA